MEGTDVVMTATVAQLLGLALHELATNAVKYGSLSVPNGKVIISWDFDDRAGDARKFQIRWVDTGGGPSVVPPLRKGFGHVVIEHAVAQSVHCEVTMTFESHGLVWTLLMPDTHLVSVPRK